jgi:putative heme-binding domain-containing protein
MRCTVLLLTAGLCQVFCQGQENPFRSDPNAAETGRWIFRVYCSPCHGIKAGGGRGPDLTVGTYGVGEQDGDLFRAISRGIPGSEMPAYAGRLEDDSIWRLVSYIRSVASHDNTPVRGDRVGGEKIFWTKGGCGQCHRIGEKGNSVGPDLSRVGLLRSLGYLRASILTPDSDLTRGYSTVRVTTRDGKTIVGVEKSLDNFSCQLIDLSGKYYSFLREEVASVKRESRSLMPSTYGKSLSGSEIDDLLAYLSSLRSKR